jgi:enterochelin esterase-like enzyme
MTSHLRCLTAVCALLATLSISGIDDYKHGPDSQLQDVPHGTVSKHRFTASKLYPGTERDYWVYVPKQYSPEKPACLMVFQDGSGFANTNGEYRVPIVFDNLIARKAMPVTIAVMINPGVIPPGAEGGTERRNRSFEYDSLGDLYARFLIEELLPEALKDYNVTKNPDGRAICGNSSGGICAFTVAWERPDQFRKVVSHIGSFTNIRGGHNYHAWIRKTEAKPLRIFLQDGSNDLDNVHGNWPLANQEMARALEFKKYDYKFVFGDGAHNGKHGGSIFPETLQWIWRDYKGE